MRLKSFHGATLTDAMRSVREALGEEAIIVATREDEGGGIRVTAAIDDETARSAPRPFIEKPDGSEALESMAEALTHHGVYQPLAERLMATATQVADDDPLLCLGAAIDTHLTFEPLDTARPVILVGPSGAGKTLCTAKLATQATLDKARPSVASTDIDRAGGMAQLEAFTKLLQVRLIEIDDWHALRDLVSVNKGRPLFIDTAGRNPFVLEEKGYIRDFIGAVGDATLVLPADLDAAEAVDMAQAFKELGASRLLATRLDTVRRVGNLLRVAFETRLPLTNFSASAKVTEPMMPMNPVVLARRLLGITAGASRSDASSGCLRKAVL
ncbi:MAG: GTPase [Alphaproteobacteria bacterium]|nr:GTPase [Alphaproteobacteria bacterium]